MFVVNIIIAVLLVVMGIVILIGKGDNLIAGYNTASREERARIHIKRLRGLVGGVSFITAILLFLLGSEPSVTEVLSFSALVFILCIIVVVLANTWAKKKRK